MKKDYYKNLTVSTAPDSEMLIEGEIPAEIFDAAYEKVLKAAYETITVPGFRAGKAPENVAKTHLNGAAVLDHATEDVLNAEYPKIVDYHKISPIDHPKIQITKIAVGNPLGFKITVPVMPKIDLPDYKAIAKKENKTEYKLETPTEKEIEAAIDEVRKSIAHQEYHRKNPHDTTHEHGEKLDLPEVTDEFVKSLGDFKDVADFREKIKKGLEEENKTRAKEKGRIALVNALEKEFTITLPRLLIEGELDRMMADLQNRLTSAGLKPSEYFEQSGKKESDIRKEWEPDAIKRVKIDVILAQIAREESIKPDPAQVELETKKLVEYYKETDPSRAHSYVEHMLTNDKVFEYLEGLK